MIKAGLGLIAFAAIVWTTWYASAAPIAGRCAPGLTKKAVPTGVIDPDQAKVCTA